ncbi:NAD(P)-dependent oxidoreductase [Citreimonas salinaria]|uniref:Glutamate synthase (NADPH) small subunit n=1 Tax=Citreimonas salinaria TaxID=321339 RepID=A0A1H3HTW7_9RHOB|nr:NAD(P)-dependent oxidoreductase [Citreimonas salinaria]SDY18933.1 glutamate synthase (NADPH) small subunit [Citreimonas salinaria]
MAKQPMLKFVEVGREMPEKREAGARRADFDEIYAEFAREKAAEQAARCSQCGVPYCQSHCPLHNNIPDWLKLTASGRLQEAYEISQATNTFPEICGRICPQDRLCEGNCVIEQSGHGTVTIGAVEKYITDTAWDEGWVEPIRPASERPESVGIIGAGPGGLAAADFLRRAGVQVTVYDRYDRAGGLMIYGIPGFKLEKHVVTRRNDQLAAGGVKFVLDCEVGRDITFKEIREQHDAVIIATGVYKSRDLPGPGAGATGIVRAIDYLTASNRAVNFGDDVPEFTSGELNAKGKRVVVIGGGDTAMDCVRTAIRQGATSVKCLYRRDRTNMPGSQREVTNAEEEGVEFQWLTAPKGFKGDPVSGVIVQQIRLGQPDATGRQAPEIIEGSDYEEPADLVIKALGFEPEELPTLWNQPELEVTRWGTVKAEFTTGRTAMPGVYAVGDIVRGASLVVWAIRDGRDTAAAILDDLKTGRASVVDGAKPAVAAE